MAIFRSRSKREIDVPLKIIDGEENAFPLPASTGTIFDNIGWEIMPRGFNERAADVEVEISVCGMWDGIYLSL